MSIWFGIAFTVIIIPALMIICGKYYIKKAPKNINHFVGYRTTRSMKNKETWKMIIQTVISILSAIATTLGLNSCM